MLICTDYCLQNVAYPLFDDLMTLSLIEFGTRAHDELPFQEDSVLCVNIAHDKALAVYTDEFDIIRGNDAVVSRDSLIKFLNIAAKAQYKYILLDVRFSKRDKTDADSSLFETIRSLKNIVVSTHIAGDDFDYELADEKLKPVVGLADYGMTRTTGFSRYAFMHDNCASVPLKMYQDIDHGDIAKCGIIYFDEPSHHVCFNSPFIPMPQTLNRIQGKNIMRYEYLGSEIFNPHRTERGLIDLMKDKYILIGDFDDDLHNTYVGNVPGPMLLFLSYTFLKEGKHIYPLSLFLFLLIVFSAIYMGIFCFHNDRITLLPKVSSKFKLGWHICVIGIIKFILTIAGWSLLIYAITWFVYQIYGIAIISILPTCGIIIFSYIIPQIKQHRKQHDTIS